MTLSAVYAMSLKGLKIKTSRTSISIKKIIIAVTIFVVILALARWASGSIDTDAPFYSITPPLLAIILAFVTRKVLLSLGSAIIVGGILTKVDVFLSDPLAIVKSIGISVSFITESVWDIESFWILSFVVLIFVMLKIIIASGGFNGLVELVAKFVRGKKTAQLITAILGVIFFIDDYANAIIIGSTMRPVIDRFKISREKLAFIVDATSAPVTGLAIISTWIAVEVNQFSKVGQTLGIEKNGYAMFFDAIQFRFYCVLMLIFMFVHILMGTDFGPMKSFEERENDISSDDEKESKDRTHFAGLSAEIQRDGKARSAIVPVTCLLIFHITALWVTGGGYEKLSSGMSIMSLSYWRATISGVKSSSMILALSSSFGLIMAFCFAIFYEKIESKILLKAISNGARNSLLPISVLVLAWSLKMSCDELGTDRFLSSILAKNISPMLFPAIVFIVASITSFATGTSWGTMTILIPTAIPVAFTLDGGTYGLTTMISLGAVLDGAIFGDHCSPISDTTIISSISSRCDLIKHVQTQLPYSLFVATLAVLCGYLPAAIFGLEWFWSVALATLVMVIFFLVLSIIKKSSGM